MIQSMTGYGKAEINLKNINFTIEVKSLNSKQIDVSIRDVTKELNVYIANPPIIEHNNQIKSVRKEI